MTNERKKQLIPPLDGFRVLMIAIVAAFHLWQQSWFTPRVGKYSLDWLLRAGYLPVDATVLLSAFLLFLPYAGCCFTKTEPEIDAARFYRKRAKSVLPGFNAAMVITLLAYTLPFGKYPSVWHLMKDILSHFSMTFTFIPSAYLSAGIPTTAWTLVILVQFYLLFPYIARAMCRRPWVTFISMTAAGFLWRLVSVMTTSDLRMAVNQLPSFLDVLALGMVCAAAYVKLRPMVDKLGKKQLLLSEICATAIFAAACFAAYKLFRHQAYHPPMGALQAGQMILRHPLAVVWGVMVLSLPFVVRPLRFLFGNRVTRYLSRISINFYLLHQLAALIIKAWDIIPHQAENPAKAGELSWQAGYLAVSVVAAVLVSVGVDWVINRKSEIGNRK